MNKYEQEFETEYGEFFRRWLLKTKAFRIVTAVGAASNLALVLYDHRWYNGVALVVCLATLWHFHQNINGGIARDRAELKVAFTRRRQVEDELIELSKGSDHGHENAN